MSLIGKVLCQVGFHAWVYQQPVFAEDSKGAVKYPRVCSRCQRERGR